MKKCWDIPCPAPADRGSTVTEFPTISLVTVCFNNAETIEDTILSVAAQKYPHLEYIIVDGLSTDNTLEIVRKHTDLLSLSISEKDTGIYDAMNKGIACCTGDIIGLINADDILADDAVLQRISSLFSEHPEIQACYGDLCYVQSDDLTKVVRYWRSHSYRRGLFRKGWVPPHPTLYVRREMYTELGGFDLTYKMAADFELMLRFFEVHGIRTMHIPQVLVKMRVGGTTNRNLKNILRQNIEIRQALRSHDIPSSLLQYCLYKLQTRLVQFIRRPA